MRTHEGNEWLYVLSGKLRLILGDRDITINAGEVAEFDTRIPHWFGPADDQPAEILSLLSRTANTCTSAPPQHPRPRRTERAGPDLTGSSEQLQPRYQPPGTCSRIRAPPLDTPASQPRMHPVKLAGYQLGKHKCMNRTERYARNTRQI